MEGLALVKGRNPLPGRAVEVVRLAFHGPGPPTITSDCIGRSPFCQSANSRSLTRSL